MQHFNTEKEIKIQISNLETFTRKLIEYGGKFVNREFQRTIRLDTKNKDLEQKGVFLRVRSGDKNTVTLKKKVINELVRERQEFETEIKDLEVMLDIFIQLGFDYQKVMEKYRMNFSFLGTKISIDEMPFGTYVEIEGTEESIGTVLEKFDLHEEDKILGTYWDLWTEYKRNNDLQSEDIRFNDNYTSVIMGLKI